MERNIVVSGGGTGIGRAIAREQARSGDRVVIVGRRAAVLEAAADAINAECGATRVLCHTSDVTDPASIEGLAKYTESELGSVYGIVNNAGGGTPAGPTLREVIDAWRATFELNVMGSVILTTSLLPLLQRPGGRIVVISSMAGKNGGGLPQYAACKAAQNAWVLSLAGQLGPQGVSVNAVLPGYTPDTEVFGAGLPPHVHDRLVSNVALGRAGRSADVAGAVSFLLSEAGEYVSGHLLEVAGGGLPPTTDP